MKSYKSLIVIVAICIAFLGNASTAHATGGANDSTSTDLIDIVLGAPDVLDCFGGNAVACGAGLGSEALGIGMHTGLLPNDTTTQIENNAVDAIGGVAGMMTCGPEDVTPYLAMTCIGGISSAVGGIGGLEVQAFKATNSLINGPPPTQAQLWQGCMSSTVAVQSDCDQLYPGVDPNPAAAPAPVPAQAYSSPSNPSGFGSACGQIAAGTTTAAYGQIAQCQNSCPQFDADDPNYAGCLAFDQASSDAIAAAQQASAQQTNAAANPLPAPCSAAAADGCAGGDGDTAANPSNADPDADGGAGGLGADASNNNTCDDGTPAPDNDTSKCKKSNDSTALTALTAQALADGASGASAKDAYAALGADSAGSSTGIDGGAGSDGGAYAALGAN